MPVGSRYTGLFRMLGETPPRAHDPDVAVWAGIPANRPWPAQDSVGGAGWSAELAERACVGEAVERWQTHPLPSDRLVRASFDRWSLDEPAIDPRRFVRFHPEQPIPYERLSETTEVDWIACRVLGEGTPIWAPADLVFLDLRPGHAPRFGPTISTGWSAHATAQAALESAILEVIERDALVGAWWGSYRLVEVDDPRIDPERLARKNLRYRWYRVLTPRAAHVTIVTVEGEDREGYVFSIGSACRLDRRASFAKAALEAVQGRHYVRYLLTTTSDVDPPTSFAEHAAFYSRHPKRLADTVLANASRASHATGDAPESLASIIARLPKAAFRHATPPALVDHGYVVMRVIVPELQPLHGDHRLPFLGGLWNRPLADWATMPPHPFA
ncbi:MAG: YcaO-like family protein [Myxococcota bacterium]|nr:YcaO-like family protein [Deltaproteobacteria bacterium]MDQ3335021.1 YcaO-like family protein [Myxococcota bacterium]